MPPTSGNGEQLDEYGKRLDEHGTQLTQYGDRLNIHAARIDKLGLVIQGDDTLGIKGLVQHMAETNETLRGLVEWRNELIIYARAIKFGGRIALVLLAIIGGGVWWPQAWPQMQILIKLLGG